MRDREDAQDRSESELDIEEIDNSPAPRRLKSRPRELTQIDREEGRETLPPRPRQERTVRSADKNSNGLKNDKIFQIAVAILMGILLLSNIILISQIHTISSRQKDIDYNMSLLIKKSSNVLSNIKSLNETINPSNTHNSPPNDLATNIEAANKPTVDDRVTNLASNGNDTSKNLRIIPAISEMHDS